VGVKIVFVLLEGRLLSRLTIKGLRKIKKFVRIKGKAIVIRTVKVLKIK